MEIMHTKHNDKIDFLIGKVSDVLVSKGVSPVEENEDFVEDEMSHENYAVYKIANPNAAELRFAFDDNGLEVGINWFYEIIYFTYEEFFDDSPFVRKWLSDLFFRPIVTKECWFGFNFYYIKDSDNKLRLIRKLYYGCAFILFWPLAPLHLGCKTVEHSPVYQMKS